MKVNGIYRRSICVRPDGWSVEIVDQRKLPHEFVLVSLTSLQMAAEAITEMWVRGAPLIAMTGAYGICLALRSECSPDALDNAYEKLLETRPTAVNLRWALDAMRHYLLSRPRSRWVEEAYARAAALCDEDAELCGAIGDNGLPIIRAAAEGRQGRPVNILTHCNAGSLATVEWGTALAPVLKAHNAGIALHVWVDETRPRNQGALTAWELSQYAVPHTVIADNAGGHLMQKKQVDLCIVGADRIAANGDVCNKIGTYLKALAAFANKVPFYIAAPYTTFDSAVKSGTDIVIEERSGAELSLVWGMTENKTVKPVQILPDKTPVANYAFDVTPAGYVSGFITERDVYEPGSEKFRRYLKNVSFPQHHLKMRNSAA